MTNNQYLEQLKLKDQIKEKGKEINQFLKGFDIRQDSKPKQSLQDYNFNTRGQKIISNQQIHKNYENAWYFTKWYQLPFCRRNLNKKCQFWLYSSTVLTYVWALYKKNQSIGKVIEFPWSYHFKAYLIIAGTLCFASIIESLLFDQHWYLYHLLKKCLGCHQQSQFEVIKYQFLEELQ